jgi:hypothetical protein
MSYQPRDCENCGRRRVLLDGTCEKCRWDHNRGAYASLPDCPECGGRGPGWCPVCGKDTVSDGNGVEINRADLRKWRDAFAWFGRRMGDIRRASPVEDGAYRYVCVELAKRLGIDA